MIALRQVMAKKKADAAEHLVMFHRVGLLDNELPGVGRSAFIQSSVVVEWDLSNEISRNRPNAIRFIRKSNTVAMIITRLMKLGRIVFTFRIITPATRDWTFDSDGLERWLNYRG